MHSKELSDLFTPRRCIEPEENDVPLRADEHAVDPIFLGQQEEIERQAKLIAHNAEQRRRARLSLYEIYHTTRECIMHTADLTLGARKPLTVVRA